MSLNWVRQTDTGGCDWVKGLCVCVCFLCVVVVVIVVVVVVIYHLLPDGSHCPLVLCLVAFSAAELDDRAGLLWIASSFHDWKHQE